MFQARLNFDGFQNRLAMARLAQKCTGHEVCDLVRIGELFEVGQNFRGRCRAGRRRFRFVARFGNGEGEGEGVGIGSRLRLT